MDTKKEGGRDRLQQKEVAAATNNKGGHGTTPPSDHPKDQGKQPKQTQKAILVAASELRTIPQKGRQL